MRRAIGTGVGGGILSTLLAKGWVGVALAVGVVVVLTVAVCWVVADSERPQRLALLLSAWRGTVVGRETRSRR
jgi:hypothetical protein